MGKIGKLGVALVTATVGAALPLTAPRADADTGACAGYLEDRGLDTSLRVQT